MTFLHNFKSMIIDSDIRELKTDTNNSCESVRKEKHFLVVKDEVAGKVDMGLARIRSLIES